MPEISVYEYERAYVDYTLTYSQSWSVAAKRGTPVLQADTTNVYFYARPTETGATLFTLSVGSGITWVNGPSATDGKVRVALGTNTGTHAGDGQFYELRIKLSDGSYVTAEKGTLNVKVSTVENP